MNRFAALLDRLENADGEMKQRLLADYLATTPEPDRTIAADFLAARLKPRRIALALIRGLADARFDPVLYALSLDYVDDVAETIALLWPPQRRANRDPSLSEVVEALSTLGRSELPKRIETWLDACDASGRWALIKLATGRFKSPMPSPDRPQKLAIAQDDMFPTTASPQISGSIDAVLLYVERGKLKASPTFCTFGLWKGGALVPVGKAGILPDDRKCVDEFVRENTIKRFGPVSQVAQTLVLEVAFEDLKRAPRRKSGIAMRTARITRVLREKRPGDASTIEGLERLLPAR